ncbi:MAG: MFS transporter [Holophagales bacterium]|nr:MFS transporter [Holophagales bacterium]
MQRQPTALAPLLAVVFVGTLGFSIVIPFMVFLVLRLGGNGTVYGVVGAAYSLFQLFGAPILGEWSDRFGRRRILMLSQAGTALAWILFLVALALPVMPLAEVESSWLGTFTLTVPLLLVFVARALDGLTGGNVSVAQAYLADVTDEESRGVAFGRMAIAQNLGFIVGPALAGLLGAWGEAAPVMAALAISILALLLIALRLPESSPCAFVGKTDPRSVRKVLGQEQRDCHEVRGKQRLGLRQVLALPSVALLLGMHFLVYLAFNFFYVALPVHGATGLGWSLQQVGLFLSYFSALMALAQGPVLALASKKLGDRSLVLVGGVFLAGGFTCFAGASTELLLVGGALVALGNGLLWPSLLSLLSKAAGDRAQGAVQGISGSAGAVASVIGLVVGGVFFDVLGARVFLLSALVAAVAWGVSWALRPEPRVRA